MDFRIKIKGVPPTSDSELEYQTEQSLLSRDEYDWNAFTYDYRRAFEATPARFKDYVQLPANEQQQVVAFAIWMINRTKKDELGERNTIERSIAQRISMLSDKNYKHIKAWVAGTEKLVVNAAEVKAFIYSLNSSGLNELRDLGADIFGRMQDYTAWLHLVMANKYPAFKARDTFRMLVDDPQPNHDPISYQNKHRRKNFF